MRHVDKAWGKYYMGPREVIVSLRKPSTSGKVTLKPKVGFSTKLTSQAFLSKTIISRLGLRLFQRMYESVLYTSQILKGHL